MYVQTQVWTFPITYFSKSTLFWPVKTPGVFLVKNYDNTFYSTYKLSNIHLIDLIDK